MELIGRETRKLFERPDKVRLIGIRIVERYIREFIEIIRSNLVQ